MRLAHRCLLAVPVVLVLAQAAQAAQRAYVASYGNDANTASGCTLANPCRSFQGAHSVVDAQGEIVALDAAGYGSVTITKSVTILANPGVYAGISTTGVGVGIDAPDGDVVLRNLSILGQGGIQGVALFNARRLSVENCVISGFATASIDAGGAEMSIIDTVVRNSARGIRSNAGPVTIARSTVTGNSEGVVIATTAGGGPSTAQINDSIVINNDTGLVVRNNQNTTGLSKAWAVRTTFANNWRGMFAWSVDGTSPAAIHVASSTIVNSVWGYEVVGASAVIETAGNNVINGNTGNTGSLTPVALQ